MRLFESLPFRKSKALLKHIYNLLPVINVAAPTRCADIKVIAVQHAVEYRRTLNGASNEIVGKVLFNPRCKAFFQSNEVPFFPEEFVARIPNGRVHGFGTVISPDGQTVVSDASISWKFEGEGNHELLNQKTIRRPERLADTTAVAAVWGGWGYYHWLMEELPRLIAIKQSNFSFDRIICNAKRKHQIQALEYLGIDAQIINPTSISSYSCHELIAPSFIARPGFPSQSTINLLDVLQRAVLDNSNGFQNANNRSRIYISRNRSGRRNVINEKELLEVIEPYDFHKVYLEELTFSDQINLFHNAEVVIAPHGAGLANLVFCTDKTRVIELFNANYVYWCFYQLARQKRLDYYPLITGNKDTISLNKTLVAENIFADCEALRRILMVIC